MTFEQAIENATRILQAAELETNLAMMERLEKLADSWISIANTITVREQMKS